MCCPKWKARCRLATGGILRGAASTAARLTCGPTPRGRDLLAGRRAARGAGIGRRGQEGRPVSDGNGPPLSPISSSRARDSLEPLKNKQGAIGERGRSLPSLPTLTLLTAVPIAVATAVAVCKPVPYARASFL